MTRNLSTSLIATAAMMLMAGLAMAQSTVAQTN